MSTKKRTRKELILEALKQIEEERGSKYGEYEIHYIIPYNEDGGEIRGVIDGFMAANSAEALRYASEMLGFPEIDAAELANNRREFVQLDGYGVVKIRKTNKDKEYTGEDLLKLAEFIFEHYHREVVVGGTRIKSNDNREEVLTKLISLFKLPKRNKLADKYHM